jgi:nitrate reductase delta subunit
MARRIRYVAVPQALLVIAGEKPVDGAKIQPVREQADELDRDWDERPAFADAPLAGGRPRNQGR